MLVAAVRLMSAEFLIRVTTVNILGRVRFTVSMGGRRGGGVGRGDCGWLLVWDYTQCRCDMGGCRGGGVSVFIVPFVNVDEDHFINFL